MSSLVPFGRHTLGQPGTCYVIAEVGLNHNGDFDLACKLIDVASVAGADAVKFQKRTVERLAIGAVLDAEDKRFPEFGQTYRQIREHLEFDWEAYQTLKAHCEARGMDFLCTAFDTEAADFLARLGVGAYKLASHSLTNLPLLAHVASLGKSTLLSTGMALLEEIDQAVAIFRSQGTPLALMHCVSAYPTPPDQSNLSMIPVLRERYGLPVGYSGHEMGNLPTLAAVALGACAVERHLTWDRSLTGFDHKLSLEPDEFIRLVRDVRSVLTMLGTGTKGVSEQEWITRRKYHVSMVSACEIAAGSVLTEVMVTYKNPGTGIPPKEAARLLGRRATRDIPADVLLEEQMFD
jgi:sialic acid synthase SpsE